MALTDKQQMFCREYIIDLNPRQRPFWRGKANRPTALLVVKT